MWRANARAIALAGVAAGVISTLAQIVLWALLTDALPDILFRDARLAAAIVLGQSALDAGETSDLRIMLAATVVHFALSIALAAVLAPFVRGRSTQRALIAGALFGIGVYVFDLHVMTIVFPWFDVSRGGITLAAHVVFGVSAAVVYRLCYRGD